MPLVGIGLALEPVARQIVEQELQDDERAHEQEARGEEGLWRRVEPAGRERVR